MRSSIAIAFIAATALMITAEAQTPATGGQPQRGGAGQHAGGPRIIPHVPPQIDSRGHLPRGGGIHIGFGIGWGDPGFRRGHPNFRGRGHFSSRCLGGRCGVIGGAYYNPYYALPVYVGPTVLVESRGPDFNNLPSAYTIGYGTGRVPPEYVAPGADAVAAAYRQGQMEQRISSLSDEVARLREEKEARGRAANRNERIGESFANAGTLDATAPGAGPSHAATATLVFRNGQRLDVANYAVVGQTLWVFDEQRARRIPLATLNVDATRKVNAENGFAIKLPAQK